MRKTYSRKFLTVFLIVLFTVTGKLYSQSSSFGNTYVFSGAEKAVINVPHSFITGSSGSQPGMIGTDRGTTNGYFSFVGTASWSGASSSSYVDGYVKTYETGNFIFPIGDNNIYRPAAVSASSATSPSTAAYYGVDASIAVTSSLKGGNEPILPSGGPFAISSFGVGITAVSNKEYWDINGTTSAKITLCWGSESAISTLTNSSLSSLIIVGWNGSQWVAIASAYDATSILGGASTLSSGSITTSAALVPNTYSVYTLAKGLDPLDTDHDGIVDAIDLDDDNDGITDVVENATACGSTVAATGTSADCDGDGVPNSLDLDSDNDGVNDVIEAGGTDNDGNGIADGTISSTGIPSSASTGLTPPNTDGADGANPYDLDSNNDGQSDLSENGLNPALDTNGDGIVDCTTACDTDGDGILAPVDGIPLVWGDANKADLTPTTDIDSLEFTIQGEEKEFVVNVYEINNVACLSGSQIRFRVAKLSAFDITYPTTSGVSNVFGGSNNTNSDWTFTENSSFITVTAKSGITIPQSGSKVVGFKAVRKAGIPSNTAQSITVTIVNGSGGEEKINNNLVETKITAN